MLGALSLAKLYARAHTPVTLVGQTGTGKSFLASVIHALSGRSGPFTDITAGELDHALASDQLFGHERGAFTGAQARRRGLLAESWDGTLLLDDFHNLAVREQTMLLRVLDRGIFRPHGADRNVPAHFRLLVGVNRSLDTLVREGVLLPDLRYRLWESVIQLAPLEDRPEEIPILAYAFLGQCRQHTGVDAPTVLHHDVIPLFVGAEWRGNVRELKAVVTEAYIRAQGAKEITPRHLPARFQTAPRFLRHGDPKANRRAVCWAMAQTGDQIKDAATLLGVHRNSISVIVAEMEREASEARRMHSSAVNGAGQTVHPSRGDLAAS